MWLEIVFSFIFIALSFLQTYVDRVSNFWFGNEYAISNVVFGGGNILQWITIFVDFTYALLMQYLYSRKEKEVSDEDERVEQAMPYFSLIMAVNSGIISLRGIKQCVGRPICICFCAVFVLLYYRLIKAIRKKKKDK